jgi:hypothetical protein
MRDLPARARSRCTRSPSDGAYFAFARMQLHKGADVTFAAYCTIRLQAAYLLALRAHRWSAVSVGESIYAKIV